MKDQHHGHVFWFFGVLVALGVENATTPVVAHFLTPPREFWPYGLEALRLVVFLLVSVRFLLGAAIHFEEIRKETAPGSYGVDLVSAFFHFLLLFTWSLTVEANWPAASWITPFLALMFCVIGYDLVWMILCWGNTTPRARGWAAVNGLTLMLSLLAFSIAKALGTTPHWEQIPAILIVGVISLVDLGEITSGKRYIIPWIVGWLRVDISSSATSEPSEEADQ